MPTDDYIKRSDLLDFLQIIPIDLGYREIEDVKEYVRNAPAADVEPKRKTGRWIDENPASFWDPLMHCSVCGEVNIPLAKWRFCPMCGAQMDAELPKGEDDDNKNL